MSAIETVLDDAKRSLEDLKRKSRYKKANRSRDDAAELQVSLNKCRGQLETCKKEFHRTVDTQKRAIAEGKASHADTLLQEQMLYDAAVGYMLVLDAIYALKTINSYDSVAHAYDMLDAAVGQMKGKKNKLLGMPHPKPVTKRNAYGYITSTHAVDEKKTLLEGFFEDLKNGADIDQCIEKAYSGKTSDDLEEYAQRLQMAGGNEYNIESDDLSSID